MNVTFIRTSATPQPSRIFHLVSDGRICARCTLCNLEASADQTVTFNVFKNLIRQAGWFLLNDHLAVCRHCLASRRAAFCERLMALPESALDPLGATPEDSTRADELIATRKFEDRSSALLAAKMERINELAKDVVKTKPISGIGIKVVDEASKQG